MSDHGEGNGRDNGDIFAILVSTLFEETIWKRIAEVLTASTVTSEGSRV